MLRMWRDKHFFWQLDRNGRKIPTEIKVMYDLRGRGGSQYVVRVLKWRVALHRKKQRVYMAYCGLKDLGELLERYEEKERTIPEPFVWHCAEALATAGVAMLQGDLELNRVSEWASIIHRDWKPRTVFLDTENPFHYSMYPTPRVGDFGYAAYNRSDGDHSYAGYPVLQQWGSKLFTAPEQGREDNGAHTSKSDVWAVGCCLASLMWRREGIRRKDWHKMNQEPEGWEPYMHEEPGVGSYSDDLCDLVSDCMQYRQDDRPTFPRLLRRILRLRERHNQDLHKASRDSVLWTPDNLLRLDYQDHVRLDLAIHG